MHGVGPERAATTPWQRRNNKKRGKTAKGLDEAAAARNQEQVGTDVHGAWKGFGVKKIVLEAVLERKRQAIHGQGQWREGGLWGVYQLRR